MACPFFCAVICIGIFLFLLPLLKILLNYSVGKLLYSKRHLLKSAGEWAVITGANAGIGKAFAEELASDGLNIMLIGRNKEQLESVSVSLESTYRVKSRVVVADFCRTDVYEELERQINSLTSIACLINNVGMSYEHADEFATGETCSFEFIRRLLDCNVLSAASMTRIVLPKMLKGASGGAVINISSASGFLIIPLLSLYAGSKAFVKHFTACLASEIPNNKVIIQCYTPWFVATKMAGSMRTSITVPDPNAYAKSALNMLGVNLSSCGYFWHEIIVWITGLLPPSLIKARLSALRDKALAKKRKAT